MKLFNANYNCDQKLIGRVWLNGKDVTDDIVFAYMSNNPNDKQYGFVEYYFGYNYEHQKEITRFLYGNIEWEKANENCCII